MVDIGLLSFAFSATIAACWAWELRRANHRINQLEDAVAEMRRHLGEVA